MTKTLYVGLDVHRASISVTIAEEGRDGAVRFLGAVPNTPTTSSSWPGGSHAMATGWSSATRPAAAVTASTAS